MTPDDIREILVTRTGVDPDTFVGNDDKTLRDLEIDSLAVLELQAVVYERYNAEIPSEVIDSTVADITALVNASSEEVA
nr:acyl carrier protein [Micromonospora sp. DSM 115978]